MPSGQAPAAEKFIKFDGLPLLPPETVCDWGSTLVVAPHPDDESLGCGGAIALLRRFSFSVQVLFISDGTGSHPNSRRFPPAALRDLRESEAREALALLDVPASASTFLRLPDSMVPDKYAPGFSDAVRQCRLFLEEHRPQTVLLPWRRDPHPDHRATSQIFQEALGTSMDRPRLLEYPIWAWERAAPEDLPEPYEVRAFRLDICRSAGLKQCAVAAHRSQVTRMIDDDPQGFWLSPEVLAHFERPWEVFLEILSW